MVKTEQTPSALAGGIASLAYPSPGSHGSAFCGFGQRGQTVKGRPHYPNYWNFAALHALGYYRGSEGFHENRADRPAH
jgi:hypothetical protein